MALPLSEILWVKTAPGWMFIWLSNSCLQLRWWKQRYFFQIRATHNKNQGLAHRCIGSTRKPEIARNSTELYTKLPLTANLKKFYILDRKGLNQQPSGPPVHASAWRHLCGTQSPLLIWSGTRKASRNANLCWLIVRPQTRHLCLVVQKDKDVAHVTGNTVMSEQNSPTFSTLLGLVSPVVATHGAHIVSLNGLSKLDIYENQDRYIIEEWMMSNGSWTYAAIFDGQYRHTFRLQRSDFHRVYCRTWWLGSSGLCPERAVANSQDSPYGRVWSSTPRISGWYHDRSHSGTGDGYSGHSYHGWCYVASTRNRWICSGRWLDSCFQRPCYKRWRTSSWNSARNERHNSHCRIDWSWKCCSYS